MDRWPYAELSKLAKICGGPEKLIDKLSSAARKQGRREGALTMLPLALLMPIFVFLLVDKFKINRAISQAEIDMMKTELIQEIKQYDNGLPKTENMSDIGENIEGKEGDSDE